MYEKPKTDRGWAGYCARLFKTIRPEEDGGRGLSGHRGFEAAFEGGWPDAPANADNVSAILHHMVETDHDLARAVIAHDEKDGTGIVGLADHARAIAKPPRVTRVTGEICVGDLRLAPIDVGFDLRADDTPVVLPESFSSVGIERDGEVYLVQGTREEMIAAILAAGYIIHHEEA